MKLSKILLLFMLIFTTANAQETQTYQEALSLASKTKKPIMITIITTTCPWCHKLENETFKNPKIANIMQNQFITLTLNKDIDDIPSNLKSRLTPTTFFMSPSGVKLTPPAIGFFDSNEYLIFLNDALSKNNKQQ